MAKRVTGPEIEKLIQLLAKVPGLGPRSARRAALHLVAIEELSYQEAAEALGIPVGTLMSRVARARKALRDFEEGRPETRATTLKLVGGRDADGN